MSTLPEDTSTRVEIVRQGAIVVNHAYWVRTGEDVAAFYVDCSSKRPQVLYYSNDEDNNPVIGLVADEYTLYLKDGVDPESWTEIAFPEYNGWTVFSASASKYTICVCLVRK